MLFLIEYDRSQGSIVKMQAFDDSCLEVAEDARLRLELALLRARTQREVVLLQSDSEQSLRRTHRRYFEDLKDIADTNQEHAE